jgi:hypothetical protein
MRLSGEPPAYVQPENLIELYCRDCSRYRAPVREDGRKVRILHLFNVAGEFVRSESEVV